MAKQKNVVTIELPWVTPIVETISFGLDYGVSVEILPKRSTTHVVKLRGPRDNVIEALTVGWCANTTPGSQERRDEVAMYLGNTLAAHRFETGCTLGLGGSKLRAVSVNKTEFNWSVHHRAANLFNEAGDGANADPEVIEQLAIQFLVEAGYEPDEGDGPVTHAQTYLELAFKYCPQLLDYVPRSTPSPRSFGLDDCINYGRNPYHDCGGRVERFNDVELMCENCWNRVSSPIQAQKMYVVANEGGAYWIEGRPGASELMYAPMDRVGRIQWQDGSAVEVGEREDHLVASVLFRQLLGQLEHIASQA